MMYVLLRGVRPLDVVIAVPLVILAALLASVQVGAPVGVPDADGVIIDSNSFWIVPLFVIPPLVVVWWRRSVIKVTAVATTVMALHDLLFGHLTRCGSGLPLAFVLAFLVGLQLRGRDLWVGYGVVALLNVAVLVFDSSAGRDILPATLAISLGLVGLGFLAQSRTKMAQELKAHNAELQRLRDQNAALEVSGDRIRLSSDLDALLDQHLSELAAIADAGLDVDPEDARRRLAELEERSRDTLGRMREIVGTLRGGEVALSPAPSVTQLDALLTREGHRNGRLSVEGDPRVLPPSIELSAYRIVEHLLAVLGNDDEAVDVRMTFADDALELSITGPLTRGADVDQAVSRARERARLQDGTLDVKVSRGHARARAQIPVAV
ncbi:sensor histidine kinase [Smaragdicoccus niigatensis]|uniref:sensor histidine kinase n=1 Tax=Smaragdicoccus niigatensis TaxID=359359 RepID=UPI0003637400|nr:histidine kinase [Smaragdicoccus niigatensis]